LHYRRAGAGHLRAGGTGAHAAAAAKLPTGADDHTVGLAVDIQEVDGVLAQADTGELLLHSAGQGGGHEQEDE
jgi:hypothetical protein